MFAKWCFEVVLLWCLNFVMFVWILFGVWVYVRLFRYLLFWFMAFCLMKLEYWWFRILRIGFMLPFCWGVGIIYVSWVKDFVLLIWGVLGVFYFVIFGVFDWVVCVPWIDLLYLVCFWWCLILDCRNNLLVYDWRLFACFGFTMFICLVC